MSAGFKQSNSDSSGFMEKIILKRHFFKARLLLILIVSLLLAAHYIELCILWIPALFYIILLDCPFPFTFAD